MVCTECGDEYVWDKARQRLGGLRTHCSDCAEETTTRYLGVAAGEGKQASVQVLSFQSEAARADYQRFWYATSGMNTGKQCQMQFRRKEVGGFEIKTTFHGNTNHKGKAE
jgi:hypothetical protein